jgi:molybdopterin converting factor small subunit
MSATTMALDLRAKDVTGTKRVNVSSADPEATIRELTQGLLRRMGLVREDTSGQPIEWQLRGEREGRNLMDAELIGDALQQNDEIVLMPKIHAG